MKFIQFKIKNYKGIDDITFDLDKSPDANIYTLVGLNESGKTTILEALDSFNYNEKGLGAIDTPIKDYNDLIPISKRGNFNDTISIIVTLKLEPDDLVKINELIKTQTEFKSIRQKSTITFFKYYYYKNSDCIRTSDKWSSFDGLLKDNSNSSYIFINEKYADASGKLFTLCRSLIPSILYFPNFLFDFPNRIYLETKLTPKPKEQFYIDLIQDILNSLNNETEIQIHLIDRIKSQPKQKRNIDRLIQLMERKVSEVIFEAWNRIFTRNIIGTSIKINYNIDGENLAFLEFEIESEEGIYQLNERSLGFKWFFIFLLFTQFRPYRKDTPQNVIFLFDEPASNLHSTAQKQILKSFENLTKNCKVIYTTHSHHLINPAWLESTYVVKNEGFILENPETFNIKKTNITIEPYREFAAKHPHNTAYFQPILDVLDHVPSNLETLPNCVFFEGKNDYYSLSYFKDVLLKSKYNLNMSPSTGSGNLDTLISLYIGWGKEFIILLDSDEAGKTQKKRYIDKFGILVERRVFTLFDVDSKWVKTEMETLFNPSEALIFQKESYPSSEKFNKTQFNRAIQEHLINKIDFKFSEETINNFDKILSFLNSKINI